MIYNVYLPSFCPQQKIPLINYINYNYLSMMPLLIDNQNSTILTFKIYILIYIYNTNKHANAMPV